MAESALLQMEAMLAVAGRFWFQKGADFFRKTLTRLQHLAGIGEPAKRTDDAKANRKKLGLTLAKLGLTPSGKTH